MKGKYFSKVITLILVIFFISVWFADIFVIEPYIYAILPLAIAAWRYKTLRLWIILFVLIIAGNYQYHRQYLAYDSWNYQPKISGYSFEGKVQSPAVAKGENFSVKIFIPENNLRILLVTKYPDQLQYGNLVKFKCSASQLPQDSYRSYLIKEKVQGVCNANNLELVGRQPKNLFSTLYALREWLINSINLRISEPQSSLLSGILIGGVQNLPQAIIDDFRRTGTSHMIAVSGFNVSIIINVVASIFTLFLLPRRHSFWLLTAGLIVFLFICGFQASILRAVLMGWTFAFSKTVGRYVNSRNLVLFAAAALVIFNPFLLRYDIGFQLSFAATLGLMYLVPLFEKMIRLDTWKNEFLAKSVGNLLMPTMAAYFATLPISLYYFGTISLISPVTNILAAPLIPLAMLLGFFLIISGWIPIFSYLISFSTWLDLSLIIKIIHYTAQISWSAIQLDQVSDLFVVGYYIAIFALYQLLFNSQKIFGRLKLLNNKSV